MTVRTIQLAKELMDAADETTDIVESLAYPLSVAVISDLLGVPRADSDKLRAWSHALARGVDPGFTLSPEEVDASHLARREMSEYFVELAKVRRAEPQDDLISALVAVEESGDQLSHAEVIATSKLLLLTGHETVVGLTANAVLALARHPGERDYLRAHPERMEAAIEEFVRYDGPLQFVVRTALEDAEVAGQKVVRGDHVVVLLGAANHDPAVYADPDRLDLRSTRPRHLGYGAGVHFCLGAQLARLEMTAILTVLLQRAPKFTLATDQLRYKPNLLIRGPESLPIRLSSC